MMRTFVMCREGEQCLVKSPNGPIAHREDLQGVLEGLLPDREGGHIILLTDDERALAHAQDIESATGLYVLRPFDVSSERELLRMKKASSLLAQEVAIASDASYRSSRRNAAVAVALDGRVARIQTRRSLRVPLHIAELTGILQGNSIHLEGPKGRRRIIYSDSRAAIHLALQFADATDDDIARMLVASNGASPYGSLHPWIMRRARELGKDLESGATRVRWVRAHCEHPEHVQDHLNIVADQVARLLTRRGLAGDQRPLILETSRELVSRRFPQVQEVHVE